MGEKNQNDANYTDEKKLPAANILVAGITGTGKSTLLNAVFGDEVAKTGTGKPVTEHMDEYQNPNVPIHIWDTVGLELDSEKTEKSINDIRNTIASKAASDDHFDVIHAIWYCINSGSNRYQGAELEFIKKLHSIGVPFIIVLTQCTDITEKINQFENEIKRINEERGMGDIDIVQVCAKDFETRLGTIPAFGLDELVNVTLKKLPEFLKTGFIAAQKVSKEQKRTECEKQIIPYVKKALNGNLFNVPIIQIFTTKKELHDMMAEIVTMYNNVLEKTDIDQIIEETQPSAGDFWNSLINPLNGKYKKRVDDMFERKLNEGFKVDYRDMTASSKTARMIAYYGFVFIESIEYVWDKLVDNQVKDMEIIVNTIVDRMNKYLKGKAK